MKLDENGFKAALSARKRLIGVWSNLASPMAVEVLGGCGFDWLLIDMEHGPNELGDVVAQMQVLAGGTTHAVVRIPWNDSVMIKRVLDAGARNVLIPFVQNEEEAAGAVAAMRYPPQGIRGVGGTTRATAFGRVADYPHIANDQVCTLLQVETAEALERLEAIAGIDGVDGVFLGPSDLAASMGLLGQPKAEAVQKALKQGAERLAKLGKPAGIISTVEEDAQRYLDWGFSFVAVAMDSALLARQGDRLAKRFQED